MRILSTIIAVTVVAFSQHGCGDKDKGETPVASTDNQKLLQEAANRAYGEAEGKKKMGELLKAAKANELKDKDVEEFINKVMTITDGFKVIFPGEKADVTIDDAKKKAGVKRVMEILKEAAPADKPKEDEKAKNA